MGKYQVYPEYKDSGVKWLGEIPAHWQCVKTSYFFKIGMGQTILKEQLVDDGLYPVYSATEGDSFFGHINNPSIKLTPDDIVIPARGNSIGAVKLVNQNATTTQTTIYCKVLKPNLLLSKFVYYFFKGERKNLFWFTQTAIPQITTEEVGSNPLLLPLVSEQAQIADFLDHETAKIDTLIEKQQQLIKLLKEKRQAVISHAVTKGLNPQAPMKDSGVEWCDYIPEHWRIGKLGYFARVGNGATPSRENQSFWNDGTIGWLNSSKVNDVIITEAEQFITPLALAQTSVQPVKANDLVIAITGEGQTRGRVAICQLEATINQHLASIRIYDDCLHHEFLFLWLSANYERIRFESTGAGSTKGAITCGDIKSYPIVIAPLSEQTEIINHIKLQNQHFSNLIAKADNQVQLLKERRTALISAAVTGKIDVRNWQAPSTSITKIPEGEV
ncbi:restriction endonuclease subunit S [Vibrio parahaemolyticus]|nr:restriction endonuclease subunit S [Vibrio parahaemolyticus]EKK9992624.1 restriction endonuclease subunit S [Vibrio parahaemolyticus]EME0834132.1 restriction endonuclease subunit S [Vibrio parahaemolyticus]